MICRAAPTVALRGLRGKSAQLGGWSLTGTTRELEHWPFEEPAGTKPGPTNTFAGTLKKLAPEDHAPVDKCNVRVGELLLDPIIILDKK